MIGTYIPLLLEDSYISRNGDIGKCVYLVLLSGCCKLSYFQLHCSFLETLKLRLADQHSFTTLCQMYSAAPSHTVFIIAPHCDLHSFRIMIKSKYLCSACIIEKKYTEAGQ